MLAPAEFVALWGTDGPLQQFSRTVIERLSIADADKDFLVQAGLPKSAAPFLAFGRHTYAQLPTVTEIWHRPESFARYRIIGDDGEGSPIALDEEQKGEVVLIDHEFKFARIFINSSIRQLAESLIVYRQFIRDTQQEFGEDAYIDGLHSPAARDALRQSLTTIDQAATKPGCFWEKELRMLDANASE
jgi:hypothetical protein